MGRPRYYWYSYVKKTLYRYPNRLHEIKTMQAQIAEFAICKAVEETKKRVDGEERIRLVQMVFFNGGTHNTVGAAQVLNISPRTAEYWASDFIYLVGKYMGMS